MARRSINAKPQHPDARNLDKWKSVDVTALEPADRRELYERREKAVCAYFAGVPLRQIRQLHNVDPKTLRRLVRRAQSIHDDGELWGWRALIPYKNVNGYKRKSDIPVPTGEIGSNGLSGAFIQLIEEFLALTELILLEWLGIGIEKNKPTARTSKMPFEVLHAKFIATCKKLGIKENQYPLNSNGQARESLRRYCKSLEAAYFPQAAKERGGPNAGRVAMMIPQYPNTTGRGPRIYRRWIFDGHRIDAIHSIRIPLPDGGYQVVRCRRNWLLGLWDADSHACLAVLQTNGQNYRAEDVLKLIELAVMPRKRRELMIPGLAYLDTAGLPQEIEELQWGLPDEICFDNAWSHLAKAVQNLLQDKLECSVNPGAAKRPEARALAERWYGKLEERTGHQLVSTVGSGPNDPRRKNPEKAAEDFEVESEEIGEILELEAINMNGEMHGGDGMYNRTPLQVLRQMLQRGARPRQLEEEYRGEALFATIIDDAVVKGGVKSGKHPYINLIGAVYRSQKLTAATHLFGTRLRIKYQYDDMRKIKVFLPSGEEFDDLHVTGGWATWKHSLKIRQTILKLGKSKKISVGNDPIGTYHRYLEEKVAATKDRSAASDLEEIRRVMGLTVDKKVKPSGNVVNIEEKKSKEVRKKDPESKNRREDTPAVISNVIPMFPIERKMGRVLYR